MFRVFFSGFSHGQANIRALHRMLRGAVGEQRAGHFPRGDVGVRQQEQQKHQAQQVDALHQTHLAHARPTRPGRRGDRPAQGQSQELHGHVKRARWWGQMRCGKRWGWTVKEQQRRSGSRVTEIRFLANVESRPHPPLPSTQQEDVTTLSANGSPSFRLLEAKPLPLWRVPPGSSPDFACRKNWRK